VAQTSARLKEAAKLGFGRAVLPESARGEVGSDGGLALNSVGGLTSLVAEIAARGSPRNAAAGNRNTNREGVDGEKCHTGAISVVKTAKAVTRRPSPLYNPREKASGMARYPALRDALLPLTWVTLTRRFAGLRNYERT